MGQNRKRYLQTGSLLVIVNVLNDKNTCFYLGSIDQSGRKICLGYIYFFNEKIIWLETMFDDLVRNGGYGEKEYSIPQFTILWLVANVYMF